MKSSIRRYCNEGHDVLSAKDTRTALSERPVRGTTACVYSIDETKQELEVNKIDGFSKYHNFKFEEDGIRVWKAYGIGQGKLILYRDTIPKPQGPTGLAVDKEFFPFRDTRFYNVKAIGDTGQYDGLFCCSEPGCQMVFKKFSDLENHHDVGDHSQASRGSDTVYDKLRIEWAEKFQSVDKEQETSAPGSTSSERPCKSPAEKTCSDPQFDGWALQKARSGAARFTTAVKEYLTAKFDNGERTGTRHILKKLLLI